ncbi:MAG TPA: S1C family serine protease, partial [Casimicrobiaceae bacterium]|nr:S1C family serine protease [Casimicrobiaceae bacterium]
MTLSLPHRTEPFTRDNALQLAWRVLLVAALGLPIASPAYAEGDVPHAASTPPPSAKDSGAKLDPDRIFSAIVKVSTESVPHARSAESLGTSRQGTGVVIGKDGLILTIGYLIVEAGSVQVTDGKGHVFPARVIAYDQATGLGLVRTIVPLDATPLGFGDSGKIAEREPV